MARDRSRDEAAFGAEVLRAFGGLNVLIVGDLKAFGTELAKNVILTGPRSVTLHDSAVVTASDLGLNYYLTPETIGQRRDKACQPALQELNDLVAVTVAEAFDADVLAKHQALILINQSRPVQLEWNARCRAGKVAFFCAEVRGAAGYVFTDLGDSWTVNDRDGENLRTAVVNNIKPKEGDPTRLVVYTDASQQRMHNFSDGDYVIFSEVKGMERLNDGVPRRIDACRSYIFEVVLEGAAPASDAGAAGGAGAAPAGESAASLGVYAGGGLVSQQKVPFKVAFAPLSVRLEAPLPADDPMGMLITPDMSNWMRSEQMHAAFAGLHAYAAAHDGAMPPPRDAAAAAEVAAAAKAFAAGLKGKDGCLQLEEVDEALVARVAALAAYELPPLSTFLSGVLAQELVKLTRKFTPLRQFLYYDALGALATAEEEAAALAANPDEFTSLGGGDARYDSIVGLLGRTMQGKLARQRVFLVGAGAVGCEQLKNLGALGVGSGGLVTVTDMDRIETSNLSRQFLYRNRHVGGPKSTTSVAEIARMYPGFRAVALQAPVGDATEAIFSDAFFADQDIVINALDNVEARKYVDRRCVDARKPLLECGTLGTKANSQVVKPLETETYSDGSDPEEEAIPVCTLKELPYLPEHCCEWARSLFGDEFEAPARAAAMFRDDPAGWIAARRAEAKSKPAPSAVKSVLATLEAAAAPTLQLCIDRARLLFERFFVTRMRNLAFTLPEDHVDPDTKKAYWGGRRRFPHFIAFDVANPQHADFLVHAATLYAAVFKVDLPAGWDAPEALAAALAKTPVPEWVPEKVAVDEGDKDDADKDKSAATAAAAAASTAREQVEEALAAMQSLVDTRLGGAEGLKRLAVEPQAFEKDDDSNHHIDFMTAASNLRAACFAIKPLSRAQVRVTAGRIIPAIATTTCAITGLVAIELIKLVAGKPVDAIRQAFFNLAINTYAVTEPGAPLRFRSGKPDPRYAASSNKDNALPPLGKVVPDGFTHWERFEHPEDDGKLTPEALRAYVAAQYKLTAALILIDIPSKEKGKAGEGKILYNNDMKSHREGKAKTPLRDLYTAAGFALHEGRDHFDVNLACEDEEGAEVITPRFRVRVVL